MSAARDELRRLVEHLPKEQLSTALSELQRLSEDQPTGTWPPKWFGTVTAGRGDTSQRVDEILVEGFGR